MEHEINYIDRIQQSRKDRERKMLSNPLNWFSLVGLFPLQVGINPVGRGEHYPINIPGLSPGATAIFFVEDHTVRLVNPSAGITVNGQPGENLLLRQDVEGDPDLIEAGNIAMRVIRRDDRLYLRTWDREAEGIRNFSGLKYFSVNPSWCIKAKFLPFASPRIIRIQNAIGGENESVFTGVAHFTVDDTPCSLVAEDDGEELLFSFTDLTRTDLTYPGGRFLVTPQPEKDELILDFNLAVNWPCAYTAYATCPLPPAENRLLLRVDAGEMRYHD